MIFDKELLDEIISCAFEEYNKLGSGFLEKVYEKALLIELGDRNIKAVAQVPLQVVYKQRVVGDYFADIIVENKIVIELKACSEIHQSHIAQLLNYLTAIKIKIVIY
jgi:GxxExxY protein